MIKTGSIWIGFVAALALIVTPVKADEDAAKKTLVAYLKAFGEADTAAMGKQYADEVILIARSRLLHKRYGIGGDAGWLRDTPVKKDELLKAYGKAIEAAGGMKDWAKRYKDLQNQPIDLHTVTADELKKGVIKVTGLKAGDVMAFVRPGNDLMSFFLRKDEKGTWTIVAEHWE